ncbi:hypothetical protein MPDQ_004426 [Monascus purpureus]|uniref:Glycoside hydrolase family 5 domain-containing protein n=1 Tax=Monascus purpureus TaxID=5098 RepID=A0A507QH91_MONPU|nr:hypothetical protein MPDQ_004426 [Monascus purpureus]
MMSKSWGSGDPNQALTNNDTSYLAYDDHRYLKYNTSIAMTKDSYLSASCGENASDAQDTPVVVSEWSLSPAQAVEGSKAWAPESKSNKKFYKKWFAAQVHAFEKGALGWVFWGWKQELGDYRWGYQDAVNAGVIPKDLGSVLDMKVCSGQIKKQITPSVRNMLVICLVIAISFPLMK